MLRVNSRGYRREYFIGNDTFHCYGETRSGQIYEYYAVLISEEERWRFYKRVDTDTLAGGRPVMIVEWRQ